MLNIIWKFTKWFQVLALIFYINFLIDLSHVCPVVVAPGVVGLDNECVDVEGGEGGEGVGQGDREDVANTILWHLLLAQP